MLARPKQIPPHMPSRLSDNGPSHLSSRPKDQKTHIPGGSAHTVPQVCAASLDEGLTRPVTTQHHSDRLHTLTAFPSPGPRVPDSFLRRDLHTPPPHTRPPGSSTHHTQLLYPMLTFLEPAVHKNSNASSVHLTLSLWRRHRLARTSFSEVTLGPVSLILSRQARLHGEFVLLLP